MRMTVFSRNYHQFMMLVCLVWLGCSVSCVADLYAGSNETFIEKFDNVSEGSTIHGVNGWVVQKGEASSAVVEAAGGFSGKALNFNEEEEHLQVARSSDYGNVSPAWIEYVVKPGLGASPRKNPSEGIGAVEFNFTGQILAANGKSWVPTGLTFDSDSWYRVLMKIDFLSKNYSVYITQADTVKSPFLPDKENLAFIDPSINSISKLTLYGTHRVDQNQDAKVDGLVIHFVDKINFENLAEQKIAKSFPSDPITIQLENANGERQTAWEDIELELQTTSETGEFSLAKEPWNPVDHVTIVEGTDTAIFFYKDEKTGKPIITAKEYPDRGWNLATQEATVLIAGSDFTVAANPQQIAGQEFTILITARDESGNTEEKYSGNLTVTAEYVDPSNGTRVIMPEELTGFQNGILEASMNYPDCGFVEIVVRDTEDSSKSGTSGPILFLPDRYLMQGDTSQIVGNSFPITIQTLNMDGQITPNFNRNVVLKALGVTPADTKGGAVSPGIIAGTEFSSGIASVNVDYDRWGTIKITATDEQYEIRTSASEELSFRPYALRLALESLPSGRVFYYVGEDMHVAASVLDASNVPIVNFEGQLGFTAQPDLPLPLTYDMTASDQGKKTFTIAADHAGYFQAKVSAYNGSMNSEPLIITVKDATVQVISTTAPTGTAEIEIELVDESGNRIMESNVSITVTLVEENPNDTADSSALRSPIQFVNGIAKIDITNLEAETVTIVPESLLGFKIKSGTIIFGRIGKSGIGSLMWWEAKDEQNKNRNREQEQDRDGGEEHESRDQD